MATVASLLRDRVSLQVNSVDRIFLAGYVPKLQSEGMVVRFLLDRGFPIPSPAALGKIGQPMCARSSGSLPSRGSRSCISRGRVQGARRPAVYVKAERDGRFGVVMIGVAQEKTSAWRGFRSGGTAAHPHFSYRRMSVFPNHYYFYVRDAELGPAFIKTIAYAPYGDVDVPQRSRVGQASSAASAGSPSRRWITGFARSLTPTRWPGSATAHSLSRHRAVLGPLGVSVAVAVHRR